MQKLTPMYVWNQRRIPVVLRRMGQGQLLRARLPYAKSNHQWLRNGRAIAPIWISEGKYWELPKAWFNNFIERAFAKYGSVYVIQPYRPQEKCAPACKNATGHECECSCMGRYHGVDNDGTWFEVSETFAFRWGDLQLACRLMIAKPEGVPP